MAIKVDREERPDVDAVYMQATQAMTGQGGWPMSVFLTPDRRPFYAGTYFPPIPAARHAVVPAGAATAITEAWRERRDEVVDERRSTIVGELANLAGAAPAAPPRPTVRRRDATCGQFVRSRARRLRWRAQVPAVDGAGGAAARGRRRRR